MNLRDKTDYIIIHCSDTPKGMDVGVKEIDLWHRERGWRGCGYNTVIRRNGMVEQGREDRAIGAHCRGFNNVSHGICMIGGKDGKANFTMLQWRALESHVKTLIRQYPDAKVVGHSNFSSKQCPSFDVESWWHNS